jgi:transposase-like protein
MDTLNELKSRGVRNISLIAVDGLSDFSDAINAVFPDAKVQLCMAHMIRNSVKSVLCKDRKAIKADLKEIYFALSEDDASDALKRFAEKWDESIMPFLVVWLR